MAMNFPPRHILWLTSLLPLTSRTASFDMGVHAVKLYRVAVSPDMLCANPTVLYRNDKPIYLDLISTKLPIVAEVEGTFRCLMLEISDRIRFAGTKASGGACAKDAPQEAFICSANREFETIDGALGRCSEGENRVTLFYSSASINARGRADIFQAPLSRREDKFGIRLEEPIVLKKGRSYLIKIDGAATLSTNTAGACMLSTPPRVTLAE